MARERHPSDPPNQSGNERRVLRAFSLVGKRRWDDRSHISHEWFVGMNIRFFLKALSAIALMLVVCASVCADSPNDLITKGDAFDVKLQASEALQYYLPAEKLQPDNVRVLVRIARQYRHLMADAAARDEKLRLAVSHWIMRNEQRRLLRTTQRRNSQSRSVTERCCRSWVLRSK